MEFLGISEIHLHSMVCMVPQIPWCGAILRVAHVPIGFYYVIMPWL